MEKELSIAEITRRLNGLERTVYGSKKREYDNTSRSENAITKVDAVTPTVLTKQGYIDDKEVVFNDVPSGNVSVYIEDSGGNFINYKISRVSNMITVSFDEPLEYTATIILSIL